jgi:PBP1b-binding outer membrane lipoprotein LpoB
MNINELDIKDINKLLNKATKKTKPYAGFIALIIFLLACVFMVYQINTYVNSNPNEDAVTQKLSEVTNPKITKDALDTIKGIESLRDQNVQVKTLFEEARKNPFAE